VYFTPGSKIIFYCNNILTEFYNRSINCKESPLTAVVLKVTLFNTLPEDGTGVLKRVGVAIL
jgi:hypothetical protein